MPRDYGVSNPYPILDPNDPNSPEQRALLEDPKAPHETGAVLRMYRAGWPMAEISKTTGIIYGPPLSGVMKRDMDSETDAHARGVAIHDERAKTYTTSFVRARDVIKGDELLEIGGSVVDILKNYTDFVFVLENGQRTQHRGQEEVLVRRG